MASVKLTTYGIIEQVRILIRTGDRVEKIDELLKNAAHAARNDACVFLALYEVLQHPQATKNTAIIIASLKEKVEAYNAA